MLKKTNKENKLLIREIEIIFSNFLADTEIKKYYEEKSVITLDDVICLFFKLKEQSPPEIYEIVSERLISCVNNNLQSQEHNIITKEFEDNAYLISGEYLSIYIEPRKSNKSKIMGVMLCVLTNGEIRLNILNENIIKPRYYINRFLFRYIKRFILEFKRKNNEF